MKNKKVFQSVLCGAFFWAFSSFGQVDVARSAPVLNLRGGLTLRLFQQTEFEFDRSNFVRFLDLPAEAAAVDQLLSGLKLPGLKSEQRVSNGRLATFALARFELWLGEKSFVFERANMGVDFVAQATPLEFVQMCDEAFRKQGDLKLDLKAVYQVTQEGASLPLQARRFATVVAQVGLDSNAKILNFPQNITLDSTQLKKIESKSSDLRRADGRAGRLELAIASFCDADIERSVFERNLCDERDSEAIWSSVRLRVEFFDSHQVLRSVAWGRLSPMTECRVDVESGRPTCDFWSQNKTLTQIRAERGLSAFESIVAGQKGELTLGRFYNFLDRASNEDSLIELSVPRFEDLSFR